MKCIVVCPYQKCFVSFRCYYLQFGWFMWETRLIAVPNEIWSIFNANFLLYLLINCRNDILQIGFWLHYIELY